MLNEWWVSSCDARRSINQQKTVIFHCLPHGFQGQTCASLKNNSWIKGFFRQWGRVHGIRWPFWTNHRINRAKYKLLFIWLQVFYSSLWFHVLLSPLFRLLLLHNVILWIRIQGNVCVHMSVHAGADTESQWSTEKKGKKETNPFPESISFMRRVIYFYQQQDCMAVNAWRKKEQGTGGENTPSNPYSSVTRSQIKQRITFVSPDFSGNTCRWGKRETSVSSS